MKLLTIAIPAFNIEKYLNRCIDSLISSKYLGEMEIIIVDDGSTDGTTNIGNAYQNRFPDIVRFHRKENGGHGSTINKALELAKGKYFKVIDGDDWVDVQAFNKLVEYLREVTVDLVITNFVYENAYNNTKNIIDYRKFLYPNEIYSGNQELVFIPSMHARVYLTELLQQIPLRLQENTFYVDMEYNYIPIPYIKNYIYYELNVYRYFIGRPDQSIGVTSLPKYFPDHERVINRLVEYYPDIQKLPVPYHLPCYLLLESLILTHIKLLKNNQVENKDIGSFISKIRTLQPGLFNHLVSSSSFIREIQELTENRIIMYLYRIKRSIARKFRHVIISHILFGVRL